MVSRKIGIAFVRNVAPSFPLGGLRMRFFRASHIT